MSKLHINYKTNLPDSESIKSTYVQYLSFKNDDYEISVSCTGESDYITKNHEHDENLCGLEVMITRSNKELIHHYMKMTDDDFLLIKNSKLKTIGLSTDHRFSNDILAKDVSVELEYLDSNNEIKTCEFHEDNVLTEYEWEFGLDEEEVEIPEDIEEIEK